MYDDWSEIVEEVNLENITGFDSSVAGKQTLTITIGDKTATYEVEILEEEKILERIEITKQAIKKSYFEGENFEIDGLEVTGVYSDGSKKVEEITLDNVTGFDNNVVGKQTLVVTLNEKEISYEVEILEIVLESIEITKAPQKLIYLLEESLDIDGLEVTGSYNDGSRELEVVELSDITGFDSSGAGTKNLTITLDGKKVSYEIVVAEKEIIFEDLEIVKLADKLNYFIGEELDITGLEIRGIYSDGSSKLELVTTENITGFDSSKIGKQILKVTIYGKTVNYNIEVLEKEKVLESIEVTKQATKLDYYIGESLNISGLEVRGIYSDGSSKLELVTLENITGFDSGEIGIKNLTITIDGKIATYDIEVLEEEALLEDLELVNLADKLNYFIEEELDITGLEVRGIYSDGTSKVEEVILENITGFDSSKIGKQTLTVTINGKMVNYEVEILEKERILESIEITEEATKLEYLFGADLDISGLEITGVYSDESRQIEEIGLDSVTGFFSGRIGKQTLTVTVEDKVVTYEVEILEQERELESIEITEEATKLSYLVGEDLDISDLEVMGRYSDGSTKLEVVALEDVTGFDSSEIGNKTLTVTIGGKIATYEVEIKEEKIKNSMTLVEAGTTSELNGGITLEYDIEIGTYEISNAEYIKFLNEYGVDETGSYKGKSLIDIESGAIGHNGTVFYFRGSNYVKSDNCSVTYVSWYGSVAYCNWLSGEAGVVKAYDETTWEPLDESSVESVVGYRLPTQVEWEYSARGGSEGEVTSYAGSSVIGDVAWYSGNSSALNSPDDYGVHIGGEKAANELGIYDMSGNVLEWGNSLYLENDSYYVAFGGSWASGESYCGVDYKYGYQPVERVDVRGFRLARSR